LVLALLSSAACEDTPDPLPEPVSFSGELARQGSVEHVVNLSEAGLVAFEVEQLELRDIATGEVTALAAGLRFGLGRPDLDPDDDDDEDSGIPDFCDETFLAGVLEGSNQVFRLESRDYCVSLADTATTPAIPEGKVALYTLTLTSTE
jgi:hypothetical protein